MKKTSLVLLLSLFIPALLQAEPANLGALKQQIIAYNNSGSYQQELTQVIAKASTYVNNRVIENKHASKPEKLAIVLDIDETSLSNAASIIAEDFTANKAQIHASILAAHGIAIQPMLAFYQAAQQKGVKVFFVTGRYPSEKAATEKNLLAAGYKNWAGLFLRPDNYKQASIAPFKASARKTISEQGYTIIANLGDQSSDLQGGYAEKSYKLPNPFYTLP